MVVVDADLHIHSRFAAATSEKMTIKSLAEEAPKKGIGLVGCGDCLHPVWRKELVDECNMIDEGTFERKGVRFVLSCELEAEKRVHHLLLFPSISSVKQCIKLLGVSEKKLKADGRPKVPISAEKLAGIAKEVDALIGPAHAFTPWTALYASFDSLADCYGKNTDYVSFLELGLSADSFYADRIEEINRLTFLSNSDCHSPHPVRLGREFNRFELEEVNFSCLKKAILREDDKNRMILNVGLPPEEGKYNESACISCFTHYSLEQAVFRKWKCRCGKRIKKGVKDRTAELANWEKPHTPSFRPKYVHVIPLAEIIALALGLKSVFAQSVSKRWAELIEVFGSEIFVLLEAEEEKLRQVTAPAILEAILAFRQGRVIMQPGGGGQYGKLELPSEDKQNVFVRNNTLDNTQKSLYDF